MRSRRNEALLEDARGVCEILFGMSYDSLEVTSYPRLASFYVAQQLAEGTEDNPFELLRRFADAVHVYNRNVVNAAEKLGRRVAMEEGADAAREAKAKLVASLGVRTHAGGSVYEEVTGRMQG